MLDAFIAIYLRIFIVRTLFTGLAPELKPGRVIRATRVTISLGH